MLKLRFLLFSIIFLIFLPTNLGFTTQYYGNARHAVLSNHCYYEELELAVPIKGSIFPIDRALCVKVSCHEDYLLTIKHCDRIQTYRGCSLTPSNYSKPYPDCCPEFVCS